MGKPINDLTGKEFGRLLVIRRHYYIDVEDFCKRKPSKCRKGSPLWHCECICGEMVVASSALLSTGRKKSCGCLRSENATESIKKIWNKEIQPLKPGERYGRLTVIRRCKENAKNGHPRYECLCDCGKTTITRGYSVRKGATRSCGCLRKEKFMKVQQKLNEERRKRKEQSKAVEREFSG